MRKIFRLIVCLFRGHVPGRKHYDGFLYVSDCERCGNIIFSDDGEEWEL